MPARKPLELHTSHHTKQELEQLKQEDAAATAPRTIFTKTPPELIDKRAKAEWQRVTAILQDMDIIGDLDRSALIGYCNAFSLYRRATEELADASLTIETEKGVFKNPLIAVQDLYAKQMRDFATKAGLSVDTRLKYASLKVKKQDDEGITNAFGDI